MIGRLKFEPNKFQTEQICGSARWSVSFQDIPVKVNTGDKDRLSASRYLRSGTAVLCPNQENPAQNRRRLVRTLMSR